MTHLSPAVYMAWSIQSTMVSVSANLRIRRSAPTRPLLALPMCYLSLVSLTSCDKFDSSLDSCLAICGSLTGSSVCRTFVSLRPRSRVSEHIVSHLIIMSPPTFRDLDGKAEDRPVPFGVL